MQFNTYSYLLFLAIAAIVFWSLPVRLRRAYVLVVSLLFYASWNVYFLVLPLIICASTELRKRSRISWVSDISDSG